MTHAEYTAALGPKITGTQNLHTVSQELGLKLDFFTSLSSISSTLGSRAQANYVAANAFLDAFPSYRHSLGLRAHTINLGLIEGVGFMANNEDVFDRHKTKENDENPLYFIDEGLLCRMVQFSILTQTSSEETASSAEQMVTGLEVPQASGSPLKDPRFAHIFGREGEGKKAAAGAGKSDGSKDVREFKLLVGVAPAERDLIAIHAAAVKATAGYLERTLRLREPLEAERPLSAYGIDSLAAVEFRNWVRSEIGVALSTLDITTAASLNTLCETVVGKATAVGK